MSAEQRLRALGLTLPAPLQLPLGKVGAEVEID